MTPNIPTDDASRTIPFQPVPVEWDVRSLTFPGGHVASLVSRTWQHGDTRHCRLCPACTANHERAVCNVLVDRHVPGGSVPVFSTHGFVPFGPAPVDRRDARADRA